MVESKNPMSLQLVDNEIILEIVVIYYLHCHLKHCQAKNQCIGSSNPTFLTKKCCVLKLQNVFLQ